MYFFTFVIIFLGMVAHLSDCPSGMLTVVLERNLMARRRQFHFAQEHRAGA